MKARMRSIYDALDLIKQKAQDTALTYNSIIRTFWETIESSNVGYKNVAFTCLNGFTK